MIKSLLAARTEDNTAVVIIASPIPITVWTPIIAGSTIFKGAVPDNPSSNAQKADDAITENHEAIAEDVRKPPLFFGRTAFKDIKI